MTLRFFVFAFLLPIVSMGQSKQDSLNVVFQNEITSLQINIKIVDSLKSELEKVNTKHNYQLRINEQTFTSISNQIGATSFNLNVFGILFAIVALGLGIYVTYIERKTVGIREETKKLLNSAIKTKEEVESINELIQKDINGLFIKIKREETVYILNRLVKIPKDIGNLSNELLSRELEREDFDLLKKAYLKLPNVAPQQGGFQITLDSKSTYKLLFFQHFLDLSLKDEIIGPDLIGFYPNAITCAFENDMTKSTEDFSKAIIDKGFQNCEAEINSFIKGVSQSEFNSMRKLYEILFNGLKNREDRFKFFELIKSDKELRIGKSMFGSLLLSEYSNSNLTNSEKLAFERINEIDTELTKEKEEKLKAEEKRKKDAEDRKRKQEENHNAKK